MKSSALNYFAMSLGIFISIQASADLAIDMNRLGGNQDIVRRAKAIDPNNRVTIVQNRTVDRNLRLEFGISYAGISGGDPYVKSDLLGGQIDLHINPRWSIGVRYASAANELSNEGERVFKQAALMQSSGANYARPAIDYMRDTTLGVISWYPMYGKINLFDQGVSQFDLYVLAGGGQVNLASGPAPTYTAGGGIGFWFTQHFSTRLEARYQTYNDQIFSESRKLDLALFSLSLGLIL